MNWDYKIQHMPSFASIDNQDAADEESAWLSQQGFDGWELYEVKRNVGPNGNHDVFYFKRERNAS